MKHSIITTLCVLFAATAAMAYPLEVYYIDGPQDPLVVPIDVHELGTFPNFVDFPEEFIDAYDEPTDITVCFDPSTPDDPAAMNTLVTMRNLTGIDWKDVWYVAEPNETFHSNYDGWVGGMGGVAPGTAFHIDSKISDPLGIHNPLIFESIADNGIFEAGETWMFVIQDYSNAGGKPASLLSSIGVTSGVGSPDGSSGSIIAVAVPEPTTIALIGIGALTLIRRRRK